MPWDRSEEEDRQFSCRPELGTRGIPAGAPCVTVVLSTEFGDRPLRLSTSDAAKA